MKTSNRRRRFLQQMLALGATSLAAACSRAPAPTDAPEASAPPTAAPSATQAPLTATNAPAGSIQPSELVSATATGAPAPPTSQPTQPPPTPTTVPTAVANPSPDMVVARGPGADPAELTRRAIAELGGIERFVKPGANVIIKPNICVAYHGPEYAATTNPQVVAAVVELCVGAGAKSVKVMDAPFGGTAKNAYDRSGIGAAVATAGGQMELMNPMRYRSLDIPQGQRIKKWAVYGDALDADVLINIPIAKDHGSSRLSLGMKNLMGLIEDRNSFHARGLHECIADLSSALRPQLTIVDAVRILTRNGPTGGNLKDVKQTDTVIASTDPVAADSYAATLFGLKGQDIGYIKLAAEMGLGQIDLGKLKVAEVQV